LHVPKTGGTSLENTFKELMRQEFFDYAESARRLTNGNQSWQNLNLYGFKKIDGEEFALQHMTFQQMTQWGYLDQKVVEKIVIVVRNPLSRLVSEYKWQMIISDYRGSFGQFVRDVYHNKWYKSRKFHQHLIPQYEFLDGVSLDDPRLSVIYFEHLRDGMQRFFDEMADDFPEFTDAELRRDNESNEMLADQRIAKKPWREFYENDPELFKLVVEMYAADFQHFGYEKNINDVE